MPLLLKPNRDGQLQRAVDLLRKGDVVGLPTETVYGLAARADMPISLSKIFRVKNRPTFDPLIVHVLSADRDLPLVTTNVSATHKKLIDAFWPGPLTLLFPKTEWVPDLCTSDQPTVAVRSPKHPLFREVLQSLKIPLAAPSANRFGKISPTEAIHVCEELGPFGLEAVLDGGPCETGLESTIVKIHEEEKKLEILRLGATPLEALEKVLGPTWTYEVRESGSGSLEEAPGQLTTHYAPKKPLIFFETSDLLYKFLPKIKADQAALFCIFPCTESDIVDRKWKDIHVLSERKSDLEAGTKLFAALRDLDKSEASMIVALGVQEQSKKGLLPAIYDRLRRAAAKG